MDVGLDIRGSPATRPGFMGRKAVAPVESQCTEADHGDRETAVNSRDWYRKNALNQLLGSPFI